MHALLQFNGRVTRQCRLLWLVTRPLVTKIHWSSPLRILAIVKVVRVGGDNDAHRRSRLLKLLGITRPLQRLLVWLPWRCSSQMTWRNRIANNNLFISIPVISDEGLGRMCFQLTDLKASSRAYLGGDGGCTCPFLLSADRNFLWWYFCRFTVIFSPRTSNHH